MSITPTDAKSLNQYQIREYENLDVRKRDELILRLNANEARAERILAILSRDYQRIAKEEWVGLLEAACVRNWKRIANDLVVMIRKL